MKMWTRKNFAIRVLVRATVYVEANEDFDNLVALLIGALCQPNTRAIDVGEKLLALVQRDKVEYGLIPNGREVNYARVCESLVHGYQGIGLLLLGISVVSLTAETVAKARPAA